MSEHITINLEGLSKEEREQLLRLVEKTKKPKKIWKPEYGDWYWYISSDGQVDNCEWVNDHIDLGSYAMGNCFRTEEEAEFTRGKQIIKTELQRYADEHNDPNKEKWDGEYVYYYIGYDVSENDLTSIPVAMLRRTNEVYFSSKEIAEDAANKIGAKRIKKYLFNIDCKEDE